MVSRSMAFGAAVTVAALSSACKPDIVGRASVVDSDRVLAVRSMHAEAKPGDATVEYSALYVGKKGAVDPVALKWSFCTTPKPLAVTGPIAPVCLAPTGKYLQPIPQDGTVTAPIPEDACKKFGPTAPEGPPPGRAADPDTTGGYYQPVRVLVPVNNGAPDYAVGVTRLDCGLAGATLEQSADYTKRYRPNENPAIDSLELTRSGGKRVTLEADAAPDATAVTVAPSETVTLRATWPKCPSKFVCGDGICSPGETVTDCPDFPTECGTPNGCTGAEPYVALDPVNHVLADRREAIRVSWFTTDGDYSHERTGRTEDDSAVFSDNEFTAPSDRGRVFLWVVLRDDRGGVGFTGYRIDVQP
ncbi:MAG TPA: hypothetical protein VF395_17180 [Polyangiaceae bacterium]